MSGKLFLLSVLLAKNPDISTPRFGVKYPDGFTAEAKEVPAPQFFQLFLTEYQKNYKNLQHN